MATASAPAWVETPRGRTVTGHDPKVGQASDQASGDGDQAGAGSLRALRGKGTSPTAGYEWATRAASASLPRTGTNRATKVIAGTAGYDPSHSPTGHQPWSGAQAGTPGSITDYEPGQGADLASCRVMLSTTRRSVYQRWRRTVQRV
jgi:hypothetical protein